MVAEIKSVEPHPESKKLHLLKVDAGDSTFTSLVCGAPNVRVGMQPAFPQVGAQTADSTSTSRKLAATTSHALCCS